MFEASTWASTCLAGYELVDLVEGACYLLECEKPDVAFRILGEREAGRLSSLCLTRIYPDRVCAQYGLARTPVVWLTELPGKAFQSAKSLTGLLERIEAFVASRPPPALIVLDGIEYLVLQNGFDYVLEFVEHLVEYIATRRATVLIPVSPKAFATRELARLERDLEVPPVGTWKDELDAREWSARL